MSFGQRMSIRDVDPEVYKAVAGLSRYVRKGNLGEGLIALVEIRASQINHCAWCLDMHAFQARKAGVEQRKIDLVAAWAEAGDLFGPREKAALALTEAVTRISRGGVTDEVWEAVTAVFDEMDTLHLLMAIATINVYNRMNVAARTALLAEPSVPA
ncbi:MAG: carboxymuconolactone decarboxylase family protein [Acidimicrobiales bacterium]